MPYIIEYIDSNQGCTHDGHPTLRTETFGWIAKDAGLRMPQTQQFYDAKRFATEDAANDFIQEFIQGRYPQILDNVRVVPTHDKPFEGWVRPEIPAARY